MCFLFNYVIITIMPHFVIYMDWNSWHWPIPMTIWFEVQSSDNDFPIWRWWRLLQVQFAFIFEKTIHGSAPLIRACFHVPTMPPKDIGPLDIILYIMYTQILPCGVRGNIWASTFVSLKEKTKDKKKQKKHASWIAAVVIFTHFECCMTGFYELETLEK
jgi:hypothetical protein